MVSLSRTVEQFNRAFGVVLGTQSIGVRCRRVGTARTRHQVYRGREGLIYVPAELFEIIVGVFGLDNRSVSHRNGANPPTPTRYRRPRSLSSTIPGQSGDRPDDRDLLRGRLPDLGHQHNSAASRRWSPTSRSTPPRVISADGETTQDIVFSASVAPGPTSPSTSTTALSRAGSSQSAGSSTPTQGIPSAPSCPRAGTSSTATTAPLSSGATAAFVTAVDQAFEDAAIQGVTVCIASGDTGSESKVGDGKAHVQYPGSDPWVLSCGGTTIGNVIGTSFDEWVWNDGSGATGGGISAIFPLPSYQVDAGVPGSVNDGHHGRGVPDVAANASVASGYPIIVGGSPAYRRRHQRVGPPVGRADRGPQRGAE